MKREDLEKLGLTKEQIDSVLDMHHEEMTPAKDELQKAKDDLKLAQEKEAATAEALKKFDGVDVAAKDKLIADLQADIAKKDSEYKQELAERDFQAVLKDGISAAKGKNAKAITALLDLETLKASKNQKEDLAAALKTLSEAEDSKMLFGEPETKPTIVGRGNPIGTVNKTGAGDSDAAMRAAMGLPPVAEQK